MGAQVSTVNEKDITAIVVVGVTGAGKSTTCNIFAGQQFTDAAGGFRSGTYASKHCDVVRDGKAYRIMDTVGFLTNRNEELDPEQSGVVISAEEKFEQLAPASIFGIDVFLYLERYGRFTEETKRHFDMYLDLVGQQALKHTVLVFTHVSDEDLQRDLASGSLPKPLQEVAEKVHAVVGVENALSPKVAAATLFEAVADVVLSNPGKRYSSDALRGAQKLRTDLQVRIGKLRSAERRQILGRDFRALASGGTTHMEVLRVIEEAEAAELAEQSAMALRPQASGDSMPHCAQGLISSCASGLALLREKLHA